MALFNKRKKTTFPPASKLTSIIFNMDPRLWPTFVIKLRLPIRSSGMEKSPVTPTLKGLVKTINNSFSNFWNWELELNKSKNLKLFVSMVLPLRDALDKLWPTLRLINLLKLRKLKHVLLLNNVALMMRMKMNPLTLKKLTINTLHLKKTFRTLLTLLSPSRLLSLLNFCKV